MTTDTRLQVHKVLEGEAYTVAHDPTIASGATDSVYIENPSGSDTTLILHTLEVTTDSAGTGMFYRSPDASSGTASGASNDLVGSSETTVANVQTGASFSNAASSIKFPLAESGGDDAGLAKRPPMALKPGESVGVEVSSDGADNDVLFLIVFYETARSAQ